MLLQMHERSRAYLPFIFTPQAVVWVKSNQSRKWVCYERVKMPHAIPLDNGNANPDFA